MTVVGSIAAYSLLRSHELNAIWCVGRVVDRRIEIHVCFSPQPVIQERRRQSRIIHAAVVADSFLEILDRRCPDRSIEFKRCPVVVVERDRRILIAADVERRIAGEVQRHGEGKNGGR
jgi:hypothetical protein